MKKVSRNNKETISSYQSLISKILKIKKEIKSLIQTKLKKSTTKNVPSKSTVPEPSSSTSLII